MRIIRSFVKDRKCYSCQADIPKKDFFFRDKIKDFCLKCGSERKARAGKSKTTLMVRFLKWLGNHGE
jgi:hypothetical protein